MDDRFDKLWNVLISNHTGMVNGVNRAREAVVSFRRHAYRFTVAFIEAQESHHNELLDMAKSTGVALAEWIDNHFDPVEQMGHNRKDLIADIQAGMTEKQFIKQFTLWGVRRRSHKTTDAAAVVDTVSEQKLEKLSAEEQNIELKAAVKALREALAKSQRDNARLIREFDAMRKDLDRAEKILAKHQSGKKAVKREMAMA